MTLFLLFNFDAICELIFILDGLPLNLGFVINLPLFNYYLFVIYIHTFKITLNEIILN